MEVYVILQTRKVNSFMVAAFMTSYDAQRFLDQQNKGGSYTFNIVLLPLNYEQCKSWDNLESLAINNTGREFVVQT